ncbi:uncharacterized protein LOC128175659 isoform X1 [Crassostrea angulata]|uniref:uncharacterized protein LOC128175659 isoform X1 n=1 Tax=Magallana angulata TaxID=2784310 RepID=UPI0022B10800|nr:uncharacterized protein LOC128175659 isoform X1 [Crassostrea angulata]XP_052697415.1 uncharacterized protein LOC128175659 isoform X1 [Crassostrea angulata]XP_052697416.1 uncharacterized protein LOC128175659 isoform X1 [Crassostrea angulata]
MLKEITRMIQSVIFTALVLTIHVEVIKGGLESNQLDVCYPGDNKMENGTRKSDKMCYVKIDELNRQCLHDFMAHFEMKMHANVKTSRQHLKKELTHIASELKNYIDETKYESIKQSETVQKNIDKLQKIFVMEIEKVQNEMIKSKHEYSKLVHQLESQMKENLNTQNLFAQKMLQAQNKLTSFMNQSKFESDELINATKTDIRGDITKIKGIIDSLRDLSDQTRNNLNGLIQELKRDVQENVAMLQKYIANEVRNSRSNINYEIKNHISEYGFMIWTVCAIQVILVFFCCWKRSSKSTNRQKELESETPELNMENSVAVVSFTEENKELHLTIARTVASAFPIHPTYVGGLNNISSIELNSKVCLVFVDKNERNIILETDVDISNTRSNFVEGQVKRGRTHVIVVYCQHEGSRDLTTLYNRNLGNIKQHATLRQLQRQNRVLTIDKEFSPYQTDYLRMLLNETLVE